MAVFDKFADNYVHAGKKSSAIFTGGAGVFAIAGSDELAAADDDTSVLRLGRLPANAIPIMGCLHCDAITSMSDIDVGLYKPGESGAVVDKDILADGLDLNAGVAITTDANNALTALGPEDLGLTLWELLGLSAPNRGEYDLAITFNTIGSGAATIAWRFLFAAG